MEETSMDSPKLGVWVFSHFNLKNFISAMKEMWDDYRDHSNHHLPDKKFVEKSVFRAFHVLRRIADYKKVSVDNLGQGHDTT